MTLRHRVPTPTLPPVTVRGGLDDLVSMLAGRRWVALTGAGVSTDSGIPDYRGPSAPRSTPMMYDEFVSDEANRRRYWARSMLGWQSFGRALPNAGHQSLVGAPGLVGVVTQNVDGLHEAAGSDPVVDLHGRIDRVVCLSCCTYSSRADLQRRLQALNPDVDGYLPAGAAELDSARLRPDGDAVVDDWQDFRVAPCEVCGGVLKPDVVFFGESARREVVDTGYALVDAADVLVVLGSSLTVMSGLRFVRHASRTSTPVAIINRGPTRGDELATVRLDAGTSETLLALRAAWR
ncbi:MAG TPA: Sir2 family NAD-dependent protein deacetylase [Propionibacteriaceae bacterium]|nr:Sir2 family NAD-dependent protein deacetylase [Propionibacteriaceae bacterium]